MIESMSQLAGESALTAWVLDFSYDLGFTSPRLLSVVHKLLPHGNILASHVALIAGGMITPLWALLY